MADEIKVLSPEVIADTPFPNQEETVTSQSSQGSGDIVYPNTIKIPSVPTKKIASELISSSMNTQARKILGEYSFTENGAIQIGKYQNGVSGDLRMTPNGITARNTSGMTTFSIDGDTGDATFQGTIQAEDFVVVDEQGLVSLSNFRSAYIADNDEISTTSDTFVDISGSSLTLSINRRTTIFMYYGAVGYNLEFVGNGFYTELAWDYGSSYFNLFLFGNYGETVLAPETVSFSGMATFDAGEYTFKLKYRRIDGGTADLLSWWNGYIVLGA